MELRFDGAGYAITGTPEEMWAFLTLESNYTLDAPEHPAPDPVEQEVEQAPEQPEPAPAEQPKVVTLPYIEPTPAPAKKPRKPRKAPETDWGKARALRNAGWTYANIARELHVSAQTVANHLGGKIDGTEGTD